MDVLKNLDRELFKTHFNGSYKLVPNFLPKNLLTMDQFQQTLFESTVDTSSLLLFKEGKNLSKDFLGRATTAKIKDRSKERFWEGAKLIPLAKKNTLSIKVYNFSNFFKPLQELDNQLTRFFHTEVSSNVYYTPSSSRCFDAHKDPYNILIFQCSGSKEWKIWNQDGKEEQFTLNAGDMLVLPKNMEHMAWTDKSHSLHLTYGIHEILCKDILSSVFAKIKENGSPLNPALELEEKRRIFEERKLALIEELKAFNPFESSQLERSLPNIKTKIKPPISLEGATPVAFSPSRAMTSVSANHVVSINDGVIRVATEGYTFELEGDKELVAIIKVMFSGDFKLNTLYKDYPTVENEAILELAQHLWEAGILIHV